MRKHRVEIDHLRARGNIGQRRQAGSVDQLQPLLQPRADFRIGVAARQAIVKQRGDHRVTLQHPHATAHGSKNKGIPSQAGGRIDHIRQVVAFNTHRFRHRLAATAAEPATVGHRPADKIDEDAAKLRLIALAKLQMLGRHHQRHQVVFVLLQPPAGGQNG